MMNDMVYITSMADAIVGFSIPERHYSKSWPKKGARLPVEKNILREAIYQPGVEYLFKSGILYIEDMDFKIELGLEEEGVNENTANILKLDDKLAARIIKLMPINEAKATLAKLSPDQKQELFVYAVNHYGDLDMSRIDLINNTCGVDLLKAIQAKKDLED